MAIELQKHIRVDAITSELLLAKQVRLDILRLDQIHPIISGNKWFKLKENIVQATRDGKTTLLTFGGAWSNHLIATASAAKALGLKAIGMVRGLHGRERPTATLEQCEVLGMQLHYLGREAYALKEDHTWLAELQLRFPQAIIIPEGGDNKLGVQGAGDIVNYIPAGADVVALPVGTGTTFAGIRNRLPVTVAMLGFPAMKGGEYLEAELRRKLDHDDRNWHLNTGYHFGGFAKYNDTLFDFMNRFFAATHIPLDMVYTAKMMYGIFDLVQQDYFAPGTRILSIHTGGLQGNAAVRQFLQYSGTDS